MACKIKLKNNNSYVEYTEKEFRKYVENNILKKDIAAIRNSVSTVDSKGIKIGNYYVTESRTNSIKSDLEKGIPVRASNVADLYIIYKLNNNMSDAEAKASAIISGRMIEAMRASEVSRIDGEIAKIQAENKNFTLEDLRKTSYYNGLTPQAKRGIEKRLLGNNKDKAQNEINKVVKEELVDSLYEYKNQFNPWRNIYHTKSAGIPGGNSLRQIVGDNNDSNSSRDKKVGYTADTEMVARERFDLSKLKKIGKGSDRTVFDLGDGRVLKVAHSARGLAQNYTEGDYYLSSIVPEVYERGLNYVVVDNTPRIKAADIVPIYDVDGNQIGTTTAGTMIKELSKFHQRDFDLHNNSLLDVMYKYGFSDVMSYDLLYGDFSAMRNWGYKNGVPIHLDGGTFAGMQMITDYRGKKNLDDADFREVYYRSKQLKKDYGDSDPYTLFQQDSKEEPYAEVINGFYSPLEKIILETKNDKLPAKQWMDKFGRGEEAKWTGLSDWLSKQTGSISKSEIVKFLKENRIEINEVQFGENTKPIEYKEFDNIIDTLKSRGYNLEVEDYGGMDMFVNDFDDGNTVLYGSGDRESLESDGYVLPDTWEEDNKLFLRAKKIASDIGYRQQKEDTMSMVKYSNYQVDGEKSDYKEILVTLPIQKSKQEYVVEPDDKTGDYYAVNQKTGVKLKFGSYELAKSQAERLSNEAQPDFNKQFKSSHFDEPNIVVHLRTNIRTDADGKKVLFLEELQSDWGQEGKKKGFSKDSMILTTENTTVALSPNGDYRLMKDGLIWSDISKETGDGFSKIDLHNELIYLANKHNRSEEQRKTPTAPFVTDTNSWVKLGLKVALKEAVNSGADRIAWTNGEQQNNRYDLRKQVDGIIYKKNDNGTYDVDVFGFHNGAPNVKKNGLTIKEVEANFGKDVAQKMLDSIGDDYKYENVSDADIEKNVTINGKRFIDILDSMDSNPEESQVGGYIDGYIRQAAKAGGDKSVGLQWLEGARAKWDKDGDTKRVDSIDKALKYISSADIKLGNLDNKVLRGDNLRVGGTGMTGFYGNPSEGSLGIIGSVAKSLFKQKPNPISIEHAKKNEYYIGDSSKYADGTGVEVFNSNADVVAEFDTKEEAEKFILSKQSGMQHSIDITPELQGSVKSGLPLFQNDSILGKEQSEPHGAVQLFDNNKAIIYAISNPNVSTPLHELAHVFEQYLTPEEKAKLHDFAEKINGRKLNYSNKKDKVAISEAFARGFEKFLADGEIDDKELKTLFDKFKEWLTSIYNGIKNSPIDIELNKSMKDIYSKMLGVEPTLSNSNKEIKTESNASAKETTSSISESTTHDPGVVQYVKPQPVIDTNISEEDSDEIFLSAFQDDNSVGILDYMKGRENNPNNVLMSEKSPKKETSVKKIKENKDKFFSKVKEIIDSGKFNVLKTKSVITGIMNDIGKQNMPEFLAMLGLDPDYDMTSDSELISAIDSYLSENIENASPTKYDSLGMINTDTKKYTKTRRQVVAGKRMDSALDKIKELIDSGKLKNTGSADDVTAAVLFASNKKKYQLESSGIDINLLHSFLMNNRQNTSGDYNDVMANFGKAFDNRGTKEERFLGKTNDSGVHEDVHALASRYLFDDNLDPEIRAFILNGVKVAETQSRSFAESFVIKMMEGYKKAAYDIATKKKIERTGNPDSKANSIEAEQEYKNSLRELATLPRIYNILSLMAANEGKSAMDVLREIGSTPNLDTNRVIEITDGVPNGIELLLLSHISYEQSRLKDNEGAANTILLQDKLATQYGRALQTLSIINGLDSNGRNSLLHLTRRQMEAKNDIAKSKVSPVSSTETVGETLDRIGSSIEDIVTDVSDEIFSEIDNEFSNGKTIGDAFDKLSKTSNKDISLIDMARKIYALMSDREQKALRDEINSMPPDNVLAQDKGKDTSPTMSLIRKVFEQVIASRLENGLDTDIDNVDVQNAVRNSYNAVMTEISNLMSGGVDDKKLAAFMRNKIGVPGTANAITSPEFDDIFKAAFEDNKGIMQNIVDASKKAASDRLISKVLDVNTGDKTVSNNARKASVKSLVAKGTASRKKLYEERRKQIAGNDSNIVGAMASNVVDTMALLYNLIAQAKVLGVDVPPSMTEAMPYSVFNLNNVNALAKNLRKKVGDKNGLYGDALVQALQKIVNEQIESAILEIEMDPLQASNPNKDAIIQEVLILSQQAADESVLVVALAEEDRIAKKRASDDERLNKMIEAEENAKEKARIREEDKLLRQLEKEDEANLRASIKEREKKIAAAKKLLDFAAATEEFAREIDRKANIPAAERIIQALDKKDNTMDRLHDFAKMVSDARIKSMLTGDFKDLTPEDMRDIAEYIAKSIHSAKERRYLQLALHAEYNKSRVELRKSNSGLNALAETAKREAASAKSKKDKKAEMEARDKASIMQKLMSNDLEFITSRDLETARNVVNNSSMSDSEKKDTLELIDKIEAGAFEARQDSVLDEFANILVSIHQKKSGNNSRSNPLASVKENIVKSIADGEVDITTVMEARAQLLNTTPSSERGEKLALLDDMLSKILGRSIGKNKVRAMLKEYLLSENKEDIALGKKQLATIMKEVFHNGDPTEIRLNLEQSIIESTGITDPYVIDAIKKAFNDAFDAVWNESQQKRVEEAVDKVFRTDLNRAEQNKIEAQAEYDAAVKDLEEKTQRGTNTKETERRVNVAAKALKDADADIERAKRNYEKILRQAPKKAALADAIRSGMHKNAEFQDKFKEAFGLSSFSDEDSIALEEAAAMVVSPDETTRQLGFAKMNQIIAKNREQGNFWQSYSLNDMWKINMLSGISTVWRAAMGGLIARFKGEFLPLIEIGLRNLSHNIRNITSPEDYRFGMAQLIGKNLADMALAIPVATKRISDIITTGVTDINSADELAQQLVHSRNHLADYVMASRATNPMAWTWLFAGKDVDRVNVAQAMGLTDEQTIHLANILTSVEDTYREVHRQIEMFLSNIIGKTGSAVVSNSLKVLTAPSTMISKGIRGVAYTGYNLAKNVPDAIKSHHQEYMDSIDGNKTLKVIGHYPYVVVKEMVDTMIRITMTGAILANRALASVDIANNSFFNKSTKNTMAYMEASRLGREYARKKKGISDIIKASDAFMSEHPDATRDEFADMVLSHDLSETDRKIINKIASDSSYTTDDLAISAIKDFLNGDTNPEEMMVGMAQEMDDTDKGILNNFLNGKDENGNIILVNGLPLNAKQKEEYIMAYLLGHGTDGSTWSDEVRDIFFEQDANGKYTFRNVTSIGERLMSRQISSEEEAHPLINKAINDFAGDMNFTSKVPGYLGAYQRKVSSISGAAEAKIAKSKSMGNVQFSFTDHLKHVGKQALSFLMNLTIPLPRAVAHTVWEAFMNMSPTSLIQKKLVDIDPTDSSKGKRFVGGVEDGYTNLFPFLPLYISNNFKDEDFVGKVKDILKSSIGDRYQWRTERRIVDFKYGSWSEISNISTRQLTEMEKAVNKGSVLTFVAAATALWGKFKDYAYCKDADGNLYPKGSSKCVGCEDGNCPESDIRLTYKGSKLMVQQLTDKELTDAEGNKLFNDDGSVKTIKVYKDVLDASLHPYVFGLLSPMASHFQNIKSREEKGLSGKTDTEGMGTEYSIMDWIYRSTMEASGITSSLDGFGRLIDKAQKAFSNDTKPGDLTEEETAVNDEKNASKFWVPIMTNMLPIGGRNAVELQQMYGRYGNSLGSMKDELANNNLWANIIKRLFEKNISPIESSSAIGYRTQGRGMFDSSQLSMAMADYRNLQEKEMNGTITDSEKKDKEVLGDYIQNAPTDKLMNDLIENKAIVNNAFYTPSMMSVVRSFEKGNKIDNFTPWLNNVNKIPRKYREQMVTNAARLKREILLDKSTYEVLDGDKEEIGNMTNLQASLSFSRKQQLEFYKDINNYSNGTSVFQGMFDMLWDSGVFTGVKYMDKDKKEKFYIPGDGPLSREDAMSMFLKGGDKPFKEELVFNQNGKQVKVTFKKGEGSDYPAYSMDKLAVYCALNGIKINGDGGNVIVNKESPAGYIEKLMTNVDNIFEDKPAANFIEIINPYTPKNAPPFTKGDREGAYLSKIVSELNEAQRKIIKK